MASFNAEDSSKNDISNNCTLRIAARQGNCGGAISAMNPGAYFWSLRHAQVNT
jgi:hypothetical protein